MGWRTVIISQHAKISASMNNLVVQNRDGQHTIPLEDIDTLILDSTQVVITSAILAELAKRQVALIYTGLDHQPVGICQSLSNSNRTAQRLRRQYQWSQARIQSAWTKIVFSKICNQQQVLHYLGMNDRDIQRDLDQLELNDVSNREAVAARHYFTSLFGQAFARKNDDALNSALNYGCAILLSIVDREIVANGYLTELGIHHTSVKNPYNLGSDLMEPFRPVLDQWLSQQRFNALTPDVKYLLADTLNIVITFNGKQELLRNAIAIHVANCLRYLSEETDELKVEVKLPDEVSSDALNDHV